MKQINRLPSMPNYGPEGVNIPYPKESQLWHIFVDFACMPSEVFTIDEAYRYHGLDVSWDSNSDAKTYYRDDLLNVLIKDGFIEVVNLKE